MKGTIVNCLEDLIRTQFGKEKWEQSIQEAELPSTTMFLPMADIDDALVIKLVQAVCKTLHITLEQAADAFGDHWVNVYAQKMYPLFFKTHTNAKDFLLGMDDLHRTMTRTLTNAKPPHFKYEWQNDRTLLMHYKSHRGLVDFVVGLAKGVGRYYKETLRVTKINKTTVKIIFG